MADVDRMSRQMDITLVMTRTKLSFIPYTSSSVKLLHEKKNPAKYMVIS